MGMAQYVCYLGHNHRMVPTTLLCPSSHPIDEVSANVRPVTQLRALALDLQGYRQYARSRWRGAHNLGSRRFALALQETVENGSSKPDESPNF